MLAPAPAPARARAPAAQPSEPELPAPAESRRFLVDGMDCAACAATLQKAVRALPAVEHAVVSFGAATLVVDGAASDAAISAATARAGYRIRSRADSGTPPAPFWRRDARAICTSASVLLLLAGVIVTVPGGPAVPFYLASMLVGGWPILRSAAAGLRTGSLDMNVLMGMAAFGAVAIGAYGEGAWVLALFAVGTTLETLALERSRRSVSDLMQLAPTEVTVLVDGLEMTLPAAQVSVGTRFVVRPGERLALDGTVHSGRSSIDQAPITGESVPVDVGPGAEVFAGTLNAQGSITITATKVAAQSTLSRVAAMVSDAQSSKAPAERFIDRFARIYTPIVFLTAFALATVPTLVGGDFDTWLYRALALLIVACPCSLVISVPVAVVSAVGGAARRGVLIKGGQALEDLAQIATVALDKTGTLTRGRPELTAIHTFGQISEDEALALVAAVEAHSEHPLARTLAGAAAARNLTIPASDEFTALPGRGARATIAGRTVWAGGPRLISEMTGSLPDALAQLHAAGQTAIALGQDDRVLALFALADQPRPEAAGAVAALRRAGISRVVMLTGDAEPVARAVAEQTGIAEIRAGLLPEDKLAAIRELQADGPVAMVGDGINDAPALAAADIGVAMGAAGSDIALQSADVALMSDRLDRLSGALADARRARSIMRTNVVASLVIKGALVLLTPFGLITLVIAVAADMGTSLLVTLNAMRLLGRRGHDVVGPARSTDVRRWSSLSPMATLDSPTTTTEPGAHRVELYEPAMCCQTGVCGPAVDQQLIDVREDLRWAEAQGARVARHNLSSDPDAFVANPKVTGLMQAFGEDALPVLVVDGDIAIHGRYPSREELAGLLAVTAPTPTPADEPTSSGGCGCAPGGC